VAQGTIVSICNPLLLLFHQKITAELPALTSASCFYSERVRQTELSPTALGALRLWQLESYRNKIYIPENMTPTISQQEIDKQYVLELDKHMAHLTAAKKKSLIKLSTIGSSIF